MDNTFNHKRTRAFVEIPLLLVCYALAAIGIVNIAIASFNPDKGTNLPLVNYIVNSSSASWQSIFTLVSLVVVFIVIAIPMDFYKARARLIYWAVLALLMVTLAAATAVSGINAWLRVGWGRTIQPCEFAKLAILLILARELSESEKPMGSFKEFVRTIMIFAVPALVTLAQGETGTVIVMGFMFMVMLFFSGVDIRIFLFMTFAIVLAIAALFGYALLSQSTDYRILRLLSFIDPQKYYNSAGYQILYSQMAIGSGQMNGIGAFVVGSISQLDFVPEDHTDFIFSSLAEAFGFTGCCIVLALYLFVLLRLIYLARFTQDKFGQLVIIGVMAMLFLHVFENIAMTVGLMPITGIPLPFISYGGSNFMTNMVGVALAVNAVKSRSNVTQVVIQEPVVKKQRGLFRRRKKQKQNRKAAQTPTA